MHFYLLSIGGISKFIVNRSNIIADLYENEHYRLLKDFLKFYSINAANLIKE